jgi:hypothetical protein
VLKTAAEVGAANVQASPPIWELAGRWRAWRSGDWSLPAAARRFREELRLPTERAVVLTGHQAVVWHPGIFSKYIAAEQIATAADAAAAWLVVDHDVYDPDLVTAPTLTRQDRLARTAHRFAGDEVSEGIAGRRPALTPLPPTLPDGARWALESVEAGMAAVESALARHAEAPDAVEQLTRATTDLAEPWIASAPRFDSLCLSRTTAFAELIERMRRDPQAAARSYNAAVARRQGHGMTPLRLPADAAQIELPLWRVDEAGRRHRVVAGDVETCDIADLAPRALLMTGLVRWLGCDLFIHGTGGAMYDRVTDAWLADWLGLDPAADLAPDLLVTATLRLPFERSVVTQADVEAARHRYRNKLHDPAALGDQAAGQRKRELVRRIADEPRGSAERARLFREMHGLLGEARRAHADALAAARTEVARLRSRVEERSIIEERTWAFPLYPREMIDDLAAELSACSREASLTPPSSSPQRCRAE